MTTEYLHCIDLSDKLKNFNFCSRHVIESLLLTQILINDPKENPMAMDMDSLRNCTPKDIDGLTSPRMTIIYRASLARKLERKLTPEEESDVAIADLEIAFEDGRRKYNGGAPSRLSCLYLAENDYDGRILLGNMFRKYFKRPMIIEVAVLNNWVLTKVDPHWLNEYLNETKGKEEVIRNYWTGVSFNDQTSWEYLLEGTIMMTSQQQIEEIEEHVKQEFPIYYEAIMAEKRN